tara:strand:+ start:370 stop:483 length:114 start_codon:yes stop_codon:yes gene_type:complete
MLIQIIKELFEDLKDINNIFVGEAKKTNKVKNNGKGQ